MHPRIEIEDIEYLRRQNGIYDVELQEKIKNLRAGSIVRLTFLGGPRAAATLSVRITSIGPESFRGTLTQASTTAGLTELKIGGRISFTAEHIHSILGATRNTRKSH
jgi:hypothetical protein